MDDFDEIMLEMSEKGIITNFVLGESTDTDMFEIDWQRLMLEYPEWYEVFWAAHVATVQDQLADLVEQGFLESDIDLDPNSETYGEVIYRVTEKGASVVEDGFNG